MDSAHPLFFKALILRPGLNHALARRIAAAVERECASTGQDPNLVLSIIAVESSFNPNVVSSAGAVGLMQVMSFNARKLGLRSRKQLWTPRLNILAGVRLLAVLLKHYDGDIVSVLVAYNSGPKPRGAAIPENGETRGYVEGVLRHLQRLEQSELPRTSPPDSRE